MRDNRDNRRYDRPPREGYRQNRGTDRGDQYYRGRGREYRPSEGPPKKKFEFFEAQDKLGKSRGWINHLEKENQQAENNWKNCLEEYQKSTKPMFPYVSEKFQEVDSLVVYKICTPHEDLVTKIDMKMWQLSPLHKPRQFQSDPVIDHEARLKKELQEIEDQIKVKTDAMNLPPK
jgi:hypothetical protein